LKQEKQFEDRKVYSREKELVDTREMRNLSISTLPQKQWGKILLSYYKLKDIR
jgi:hypothetical protein